MSRKTYVDLGFACVDVDRHRRRGFPEVIFCQNKAPREILAIARELGRVRSSPLLLTRLKPGAFAFLKKHIKELRFNAKARAAYFVPGGVKAGDSKHSERVLIVTGGTSDIPVAEEAAVTLELMGLRPEKLYDVGVAGVHRVLDKKDLLRSAAVIIVVAGMEGALASVVSGLVSSPVVAVPTSCGYGSHFEGLAALLTMLNSCSPGIAVVNIDNGFGAGYFAGLLCRRKN